MWIPYPRYQHARCICRNLCRKPQAPSLLRELFLGNIQEIGSSLSRLLDVHCRFLEDSGGLSLARATKLQLCASSHPVSLLICPSASALRLVSKPHRLLQFVQLRRHSSTVRTLLCPGETRDHDPLAVCGSILTGDDVPVFKLTCTTAIVHPRQCPITTTLRVRDRHRHNSTAHLLPTQTPNHFLPGSRKLLAVSQVIFLVP